MTMFVKFVDVLKVVKEYCFTDWDVETRRKNELAEYRRIEHLDDPPYYTDKRK